MNDSLCIKYGMFREGSQISTNQTLENNVFFAYDWLKFETLPENIVLNTAFVLRFKIPFHENKLLKVIENIISRS